MKSLLRKSLDAKTNFEAALLEWRNTPRSDGFSPAMLFLGRRLRTRLPIASSELAFIPLPVVDAAVAARQSHADAELSRHSEHSRPIPPLEIGQRVHIQD